MNRNKNSIFPKIWKKATLDDYAYIKGRIGWRGLKKSEYIETGPYLIANKHIKNKKILWEECDHISNYRYEESPEIQLKMDDIIISKDGTIGEVAIIEDIPDKSTINSTMMLIRSINNGLFSRYLYYYLQSQYFKRYIKIQTAGSTIPHLFQRDMKKFPFLLPPLVEQRGIVEVMETVDECIQLTDAVIERAEKLKRGLMQRLLTRGIGHTEYKETPLGVIPETWKVMEIQEIVEKNKNAIKRGPWGGSLKKEIFVSSGYKIYEQKNVIKNDFTIGSYYIDEKKYEELVDFSIREGDLLITGAGTIGKISIVPGNIESGIINQALIKLTLNEEIFKTVLLKYILEDENMQKRITGASHGAAMKNFSSVKNLKKIQIPVPTMNEQERIIERMSTIEENISINRVKKNKLNVLKKGLMQQLLSGKIRVELKGDGIHRIRYGRETHY